MKQWNAIIVDDEPGGRSSLQHMLHMYCPSVKVLASCASADEAYEQIQALNPDLVFLDINMPGKNGFELLEKIGSFRFSVIFTTAHDKYAVQAFRMNALDYLLKPIDPEDLQAAVAKLDHGQGESATASREVQLNNLIEVQRQGTPFNKIALPTQEGLLFIKVADIMYCRADGNYTHFHQVNRERVTVSKTLKEFDELLRDFNFFRVHQSYLVNLEQIKKYTKGEGGVVTMNDEAEIEVSRRKKEEFLQALSGFYLKLKKDH